MEKQPFISVGAQPNQAFLSELKPDEGWKSYTKEDALLQVRKGGQYKDIFGVLQGSNIIFCIDTSGSMYDHYEIIIHQFYRVLNEQITKDSLAYTVTKFNIVTFSSHACKWQAESTDLSEDSLKRAFEWLKCQSTGTSTNTLEALLKGFEDKNVDTLYLITDGLPDQRPALVIECVLRNNKGRPIVAISIGAGNNGNADLFLTDLASVTGGNFRPVSYPIKLPDPEELAKLPKGATVLLYGGILDRNLKTGYLQNRSMDLRWEADIPSAYPLVKEPPPPEKVIKFPVTTAGRMMIGKPVLARHSYRGDYNFGLIVDQHSPTSFEIKYDKFNTNEKCELHHIFFEPDALLHPVYEGDHVLAPSKPGGPYEPGTVVRGEDSLRGTNYKGIKGEVMVVLYSGLTVMCRPGSAIWISKPVYGRMITELRVVPSTMSSIEAVEVLKVSENNPTYPKDLVDFVLSKNNGSKDADVCKYAKPTAIAEIPNITPVEREDIICDSSTDQDTIVTTLSELNMRTANEIEAESVSSSLVLHSILDYERPKIQKYNIPNVKKPQSASSIYRTNYIIPNKVDITLNPHIKQLREKQEKERDKKKEESLLVAKSRVAEKLKKYEEQKIIRALEIAEGAKFRESPAGKVEEKKQWKNVGSHPY